MSRTAGVATARAWPDQRKVVTGGCRPTRKTAAPITFAANFEYSDSRVLFFPASAGMAFPSMSGRAPLGLHVNFFMFRAKYIHFHAAVSIKNKNEREGADVFCQPKIC